MKWSPQQDRALVAARRWMRDKNGPQIFRIFGWAGTGKSELAKQLAADCDGRVIGAAFTGKAALVMLQKGFPGATTIHQAIYIPSNKSRARLRELQEELKEVINNPFKVAELQLLIDEEQDKLSRPGFALNPDSEVIGCSLLIIDEVSMVDEPMAMDILSFGVKVLVLGDPAQLPPIYGAGYFTEAEPDVLLTEIHRQAKDNPIIRMSMLVREGEALPLGSYANSSWVMDIADFKPEIAQKADQILVGRNATRHATNTRMRSLANLHPDINKYPLEGEKLVCLRNDREAGVINGSTWFTTQAARELDSSDVMLDIRPEVGDGIPLTVNAHKAIFEGAELSPWERRNAQEFDYGYALTVHKAQGSQWDGVVLFDEWRDKRTHRRWLYTGITRAAKHLVVVKM